MLFPACAGVILYQHPILGIHETFPRMRGGDPRNVLVPVLGIRFSPHARG